MMMQHTFRVLIHPIEVFDRSAIVENTIMHRLCMMLRITLDKL